MALNCEEPIQRNTHLRLRDSSWWPLERMSVNASLSAGNSPRKSMWVRFRIGHMSVVNGQLALFWRDKARKEF